MSKNNRAFMAIVTDMMEKYSLTEEEVKQIQAIAKEKNLTFKKAYDLLPSKKLDPKMLEQFFNINDIPETNQGKYQDRKNAKVLTTDQLQKKFLEEKAKAGPNDLASWWVFHFFKDIYPKRINYRQAQEFFPKWAKSKWPNLSDWEKVTPESIQARMVELEQAGIFNKIKPQDEQWKKQYGWGATYQINPLMREWGEVYEDYKKSRYNLKNKEKEGTIYLALGKFILNSASDPTLTYIQKYKIIMTLISEVLIQANKASLDFHALKDMLDKYKAERKARWEKLNEQRKKIRELKKSLKRPYKKKNKGKGLFENFGISNKDKIEEEFFPDDWTEENPKDN